MSQEEKDLFIEKSFLNEFKHNEYYDKASKINKDDYEFGKVYFEKIEPKDADYFSKLFGEGSYYLTELLKYCIVNGKNTAACCKGHPEKGRRGYITFRFDENNKNSYFAYFLSTFPFDLELKDIEVEVSRVQSDNEEILARYVSIYLPDNLSLEQSEEYFKKILLKLQEYDQKRFHLIDSFISKIVNYTFYTEIKEIPEKFIITNTNYKKVVGFEKEVATFPTNNKNMIDFDVFINQQYHSWKKH